MKKTNIATTPEQSARLIACGVDPKSADMFMGVLNDGTPFLVVDDKEDTETDSPQLEGTPAWSLSATLALLPTSLTSALGNEYMLELSKLRMHNAWEVQWFNGRARWRTIDKDKKYHKLWDKSPIEACVKAIEYLTQNGYKLNEIKQ